MAELIRLDRPPADFCVSVSGLAPALEVSKLTSYLREMGGPLWSLVVHEGAGARRWAMAFFYCESDCERCRHQCDGLVLAGMRLSTQRLTKLRGVDHPAAGREGIPAFKAIDLMNHYVGFNRWSSALLHLGPATDADDATIPTDTFLARMRVVVDGGLEVTAEGIGGGDGSRPHAESSAAEHTSDWERRSHHKKAAVTEALKAALAQLCIIRFPNARVVVRAVDKAPNPRPKRNRPSSDSSLPKRPSSSASLAPAAARTGSHGAILAPSRHVDGTIEVAEMPAAKKPAAAPSSTGASDSSVSTPSSVLLFAPGAGGATAGAMRLLQDTHLKDAGIHVWRCDDQPLGADEARWIKSSAGCAKNVAHVLAVAWRAAAAHPSLPIVLCGASFGCRVLAETLRTAADRLPATVAPALICCGYPLFGMNKPSVVDPRRHTPLLQLPSTHRVLLVQGVCDPCNGPDGVDGFCKVVAQMRAAVELFLVPGGEHTVPQAKGLCELELTEAQVVTMVRDKLVAFIRELSPL